MMKLIIFFYLFSLNILASAQYCDVDTTIIKENKKIKIITKYYGRKHARDVMTISKINKLSVTKESFNENNILTEKGQLKNPETEEKIGEWKYYNDYGEIVLVYNHSSNTFISTFHNCHVQYEKLAKDYCDSLVKSFYGNLFFANHLSYQFDYGVFDNVDNNHCDSIINKRCRYQINKNDTTHFETEIEIDIMFDYRLNKSPILLESKGLQLVDLNKCSKMFSLDKSIIKDTLAKRNILENGGKEFTRLEWIAYNNEKTNNGYFVLKYYVYNLNRSNVYNDLKGDKFYKQTIVSS